MCPTSNDTHQKADRYAAIVAAEKAIVADDPFADEEESHLDASPADRAAMPSLFGTPMPPIVEPAGPLAGVASVPPAEPPAEPPAVVASPPQATEKASVFQPKAVPAKFALLASGKPKASDSAAESLALGRISAKGAPAKKTP